MFSVPDVQVRFLNGSFVHVERQNGNRTLCGMMLFDDVALSYAEKVDDAPTCIWCVARREK